MTAGVKVEQASIFNLNPSVDLRDTYYGWDVPVSISIGVFNDIVNNQSLVSRAPDHNHFKRKRQSELECLQRFVQPT